MTAPTKVADTAAAPKLKPAKPLPATPIEAALAKRGLARGATLPGEQDSAETEDDDAGGTKHEYTYGANGSVSGTQDSRTVSKQAGRKGNAKAEHDRFDGRTRTQASGDATGLVGAEAAVEIVNKAGTEELSAALEALARAGAFGEASAKAAIARGKFGASASGEVSGGLGAQASAKLAATIDRSGLIPAVEAVVEAGFRAGVWAEGKFDAQAAAGPAAIKVVGEINALAGLNAEFNAEVFASARRGVGGAFSAAVLLGASSEGSLSAELSLSQAALVVEVGYAASAGAMAEAAGNFTVSLKGVQAKFEASALAGAKASASAAGGIKLMGKKIIWAKGEIEVSAGAGGEIAGEFVIADGKLKVMGKLAATLGVGAGAGADVELDFGALATVVIAQVGEMSAGDDNTAIREKSPDFERKPLTGDAAKKKEQAGYDAVHEDFAACAASVARDKKNGLTRERVQAIITTRAPLLRADLAYRETDQGMQRAALDAFKGMLKEIVIDAGKIRGFELESAADIEKHKTVTQRDAAWVAAHDKLRKDLDVYCAKKAENGKNGIKKDKVQAIISKHYKGFVTDFGAGQADEIVRLATKPVEQLLDGFLVTEGQIRMFVESAEKTAGAKAKVGADAAAASLNAAVTGLSSELVKLRAGLVAKLGATLTAGDLQKLITAAAGKAKGAEAADIDAAVTKQVMADLDGIVESIIVTDGRINMLSVKHNGLITARAGKASEERDAAQEAALDSFTTSLRGYLDRVTGKSGSGLTLEEVQKRFDAATRKVESWAASPDGASRMEAAAQVALPAMIKNIKIEGGVVTVFTPDEAALTRAQQFRQQNGRKRLDDGEELDNTRRRMIADALRADFRSYAAEIRAAGEGGKGATKVTAVRLQQIIDKGLRTIRADVVNQAGDAAVADAIRVGFGPLVTAVDVQDLRVVSLSAESGIGAITAARREADGAFRQAQEDMTAEIRQLRVPVQDRVQKIVDKYRGKFTGMPDGEADTAMTMAIFNGLGAGAIKKVEITDGKLTAFELNALVGSNR